MTIKPVKWLLIPNKLFVIQTFKPDISSKDMRLFMLSKIALETTKDVGIVEGHKISSLIPAFLRYIQFDLSMSPNTVSKYQEALKWIIRDIGDINTEDIKLVHFTELKEKILTRGAGEARVGSIVFAAKSFLRFCQEFLELPVLDYKRVKSPKRHRREVIYLTNDEINQFINTIRLENHSGSIRKDGLRFRTLVEVLLGTGMRISEALSLDKDKIDFDKREAKIVGKGNKERTVFFTERSLSWVKDYLAVRDDEKNPLFITNKLSRVKSYDISRLFIYYTKLSGINKKITPHILRHTVATNLLFNGCPISHVKEILGHERLETTCKYYLGVDKSKAKEAHGKYLLF